jgi:phage protein U
MRLELFIYFLAFGLSSIAFAGEGSKVFPHGLAQCVIDHIDAAEFLHSIYPNRHMRPEVVRMEAELRRSNLSHPTDPKNKIAAWLGVIERTHRADLSDDALSTLGKYYYDRYVVKPENISQSYFDHQVKIARANGIPMQLDEKTKQTLVDAVIKDQETSLDQWIEYFLSEDADYPLGLKVWAFEQMAKLQALNVEKGVFMKRSRGTASPFPELNREALATVLNTINAKMKGESLEGLDPEFVELVEKKRFPDLYAAAIKESAANSVDLSTTDGQWVRYAQGSRAEELVKTLKGKNTGWCTASLGTARRQLSEGDFYVYYSKNVWGIPSQPRIAIRMQGSAIGEIRGIESGQDLDKHIVESEILEAKLSEFKGEGQRYRQRIADTKRLNEIDEKNAQKIELSTEDLRFLYEIDRRIQGFAYGRASGAYEIIRSRDRQSDIAKIFEIKPSQISTSASRFGKVKGFRNGALVHLGDLKLDLDSLPTEKEIRLPQVIIGDFGLKGDFWPNSYFSLKASDSKSRNLDDIVFPKRVTRDFKLAGVESVKGLKLPQRVGRDLELGIDSIEDLAIPEESVGDVIILSNVQKVQGLKFPAHLNSSLRISSLKSANGLVLPQTIEGELDLAGLKSAQGLVLPKRVGGDLNLEGLSSAKDLVLPEVVGGGLNFRRMESAEGLQLPKELGKGIYFGALLQSAAGLKLPKHLNGDLYFGGLTSAKEVVLPEIVEGSLSLPLLESATGLKLPKSVDSLNLGMRTIDGELVLPEVIKNNLELARLQSAKGVRFPKGVGGRVDLKGLTSSEGLVLPETVQGDLTLGLSDSAKGAIFPRHVGGTLYLRELKSAEGLNLPESIDGDLCLYGLTTLEGVRLPKVRGKIYLNNKLNPADAKAAKPTKSTKRFGV